MSRRYDPLGLPARPIKLAVKLQEDAMVKLWGRANSMNVQKAMWLIGELELKHERIDVGGRFGGLDTPAFLTLNPHGRIPVLEDGKTVVWESHSVLRYLAATYGKGRFWHDTPAERAPIDGWMDWSATMLQPSFLNGIFQAYFRTPEEQRNWNAIHRAVQRCADLFMLLDATIGDRAFLLGDDLSLADIAIASNFYRYFELDIKRPGLPKLTAYYERLKARPAYRQHVMVSFEDMRGDPALGWGR